MNVFFSGSSSGATGAGTDDDPRLIAAAPTHYRLASCHGNYLKVAHTTVQRVLEAGYGKRCEIMLDSGAFTAWSKGEEVQLEHLIEIYSDFIDRYENGLSAVWLINLDKIPAEKGRTATPEELVEAMRISDDNFHCLKERFGKRVLPVFHQNEPESQLLALARSCDYICVSPRNDLPEASRVEWASEAHRLIPGIKTHGLAATGTRMMADVPWGSVDSATWVAIGAYGGIVLESDRSMRILQISEKSGSVKEFDGHFDNLAPLVKDHVSARFTQYGFTVDELRKDHTARMLFNRIAIIRYAERYQCKDTKINAPMQQGLFDL